MSELDFQQTSYQKLVQAAPAFSPEESSTALKELMDFVRLYAGVEDHTDAEMMGFLSTANRQPDLAPVEILAQHWIPYDFDVRTAEIHWCVPQGRAVQPFYDEYLTHCRQHLVNALVVPRSSIKSLLCFADRLPELPDPSGFIFHLSRCGSTLVSGCFAELEHCSVLSESPLLTDILLARHLSLDDKKALLRLCLYLQGRPTAEQPNVIVKWNAWDIFFWELIREIWPRVPVLFLTRDPVEILASHMKHTGRHMSGDPILSKLHPAFAQEHHAKTPLQQRIAILSELMRQMCIRKTEPNVQFLDYLALDPFSIILICKHFGIAIKAEDIDSLMKRFSRHSKRPEEIFRSDADAKRRSFSPDQLKDIVEALSPLYRDLISSFDRVEQSSAD